MAGKRNSSKAAAESPLLTALKFVMAAQYAPGDAAAHADYQQHSRFANGMVMAFNGVLAAGHPVGEELPTCPNTFLFIKALEKVRGAHSLTLLDNQTLSINAGAFRALVPCIAPINLEGIWDDGAQWDLDDRFRTACEAAGMFTTEGAATVLEAAIITNGQSVVGTDNKALVEAWHGCPMPVRQIIPMAFVKALAKVPHKIVKFGWTEDQSITVYFENGAWLRTQLYRETLPDVASFLDRVGMNNLTPMPAGFFEALDAVAPFTQGSGVHIENNEIMSHLTRDQGAQHKCEGLPFTRNLNHKYLTKLKSMATLADFASQDFAVFVGDNVRVILMRMED